MQREICRAAGNPVCGDPGVSSMTRSGCRCFDRRAVKYRVISGLAQRMPMVPLLWQGMVDAERDLPGSTFDWHVFQDIQVTVLSEYTNLLQGVRRGDYAGVISLDALALELSVPLQVALRAVSASGLPLYLAYGKSTNLTTQAFLDQYGARSFVGVSPLEAGRGIGRYAIGELDRKHILGNNVVSFLPWTWHLMEGLVVGVVGDDYRFAPNMWDIPVKGNPFDRTGAWQLFTNPETRDTVEIINGVLPILGDAFLPPLAQRLAIDEPPVDLLMMEAYQDVLIRKAVDLVAKLSDGHKYWRPPIQMVTHKCTAGLFLALARRGLVEGEEYFMGCMDEQPYLCTYLAANIAALEQQTGERVTGEVNTARLLKAGQLPAHFTRRVECEMDGYMRALENRELGQFYPVCDARKGCVRGGDAAPRYAEPCSGHGTCRFPKAPLVNTSLAPLTTYVDPSEGTCGCEFGWRGEYCEEQTTQVAVVSKDDGPHMLLVAFLPAMLVVLVAGVAGGFVWRAMHPPHDGGVLQELLRKRGPPSRGAAIAAVVTDIEGSTSLWEWNPEVMKRSLAIHHHVLRSLLPKYHGYESDTEGDSFTLVFHDAIDALGWAMEVQRQLLFPAGSLGPPGGVPPSNPSSGRLPRLQHNGGPSGAFLEASDPNHTRTSDSAGSGTVAGSHSSGQSTVELMPTTVTSSYQLVPTTSGHHVAPVATHGGMAMRGGVATGGSQAVPAASSQQKATVGSGQQAMPLAERLPPIHLMQVLPAELAHRAVFHPLSSKQLSPSFFDAPGAEHCYRTGESPRDPLVICFIYVGCARVLSRVPGYNDALGLFVAFVQERLGRYDAYECEEKDGSFVLAFASAVKATCFAEAVQREAMAIEWPESLLEHDVAAEVVKMGRGDAGLPRLECVVFRYMWHVLQLVDDHVLTILYLWHVSNGCEYN
eukprot:jgi/Mesvir1/24418/Mv11080-RA.2